MIFDLALLTSKPGIMICFTLNKPHSKAKIWCWLNARAWNQIKHNPSLDLMLNQGSQQVAPTHYQEAAKQEQTAFMAAH